MNIPDIPESLSALVPEGGFVRPSTQDPDPGTEWVA